MNQRIAIRLQLKIRRIIMIATNHRNPAVILNQSFLDAPKYIVICIWFLKPESAIPCHDHQRIAHSVPHSNLVHEWHKIPMYIAANYERLCIWIFINLIHSKNPRSNTSPTSLSNTPSPLQMIVPPHI